MRLMLFFAVLAAASPASWGQSESRPITLTEAFARAEEASPALAAALASRAAAEGESEDAAALLRANPEISVGQTRREGFDAAGLASTFRESAIGITQKFEIAGQPSHRRQAAQHTLSAVNAEIAAARLRVHAEVEGAFAQVLLLQRRLDAERANMALAEEAASVVGKRVAAGEDARLDGNLAAVEAERARNQVSTVQERLVAARARLAALVQWPVGEFPRAAGEVAVRLPPYRLEDLLARAAERPELAALREREDAAQSRLELERASAFPDVSVGLASVREGPADLRERATTLTFSVPLPLFQRNRAGIGRAATERDRARIEREAAVRDGQAKVREQWERLSSLQARVARLAQSVLPRLDDNLSLAIRSYRAGESGILQLLLVNRQALDARRDYLEALDEFTQARIALELVAAVSASYPRTTP